MRIKGPILAWHFVGATLRDGRPIPPDGRWLKQSGRIVPCRNGLHASVDAFGALNYAPGPILCRVELAGTIQPHAKDKVAAARRKILWRFDATDLLEAFARRQALSVGHLWGMPEVVREYLETGDETKRDAAYTAARATADAAANATAYAAARAAASAAAYAVDATASAAARAAASAAAAASATADAAANATAAASATADAAARTMFNEMLQAEMAKRGLT